MRESLISPKIPIMASIVFKVGVLERILLPKTVLGKI